MQCGLTGSELLPLSVSSNTVMRPTSLVSVFSRSVVMIFRVSLHDDDYERSNNTCRRVKVRLMCQTPSKRRTLCLSGASILWGNELRWSLRGGAKNPGSTNKCTKFSQLIMRKIIKIIATRCHILKLKCAKFDYVRPSLRLCVRWSFTL